MDERSQLYVRKYELVSSKSIWLQTMKMTNMSMFATLTSYNKSKASF